MALIDNYLSLKSKNSTFCLSKYWYSLLASIDRETASADQLRDLKQASCNFDFESFQKVKNLYTAGCNQQLNDIYRCD